MTRREPDFDLLIKVRNNHMVSWRERQEFSTLEAAKFCDISYTQWLELEYCRAKAFTLQGHLKPSARRISEAMDMLPEEIWPDVMRRMRRAMVRLQTSAPEALMQAGVVSLQLPNPEDAVIRNNIREKICSAVEGISKVNRATASDNKKRLKLRFGIDNPDEEMLTEDAVGQIEGVTRTRIGQSVHKAMRQVAHKLRDDVGIDGLNDILD